MKFSHAMPIVVLLFLTFLNVVNAQAPTRAISPSVNSPTAGFDPETIAARVDGQPIRAGDVQRVVLAALAGTQVAPDARAFFQAQALEQLIGQRLVSAFLAKNNIRPAPEDIQAAIANVESQAAARGMKVDDLLAERGLTMESLREQLTWDASWNKYAHTQVSDDQLQKFFDAHRRDYDGTEVRARHILLRPAGASTPAALDALVKRAQQLREEISSGKISFDDAAKKFSAGPSRLQGGDVGYFPRHDRMVEAFSTAAFALEPGQISQPVVTYFGVHLIEVTDVRAGTKTWKDAKNELLVPAAKDVFAKMATSLRSQAKVEYTGAMPYLDPASKRVVVPQAPFTGTPKRP
jgi:parvulin-like peptidyl-prolyl isomerase